MSTFVGPPVPEDIQRIRMERKKRILQEAESVEAKLDQSTLSKSEHHEESESDSDDGMIGPAPPTREDPDDAERMAQQRLAQRADQEGDAGPTSVLGTDRNSWLAQALGQKVPAADAPSVKVLDRLAIKDTRDDAKDSTNEPAQDQEPSLLEQHLATKKDKKQDQDFNWERDMKANTKLSQYLSNGDFNSRFQRGT